MALPHLKPFSISRSSSGGILSVIRLILLGVITQAGGWVLGQSLRDMKFELLNQQDGLTTVWLTDMIQDTDGFLWVGSYDGLNRYDGFQFKQFHHRDQDSTSLLNDNGQKFRLDSKGRLHISYDEGGFSIYNREKGTFRHYTGPELKPRMNVDRGFGILHIGADSAIWFSGKDLGLRIFHPASGTLRQFNLPNLIATRQPNADSAMMNSVTAILPAGNDQYWIASRNGLYRFDLPTETFTYFQHPSARTPNRTDQFTRMIPEGNKGLWIAAYYGGISHFDFSTQAFRHYPLETGLKGYYNIINDMVVKNSDEFWISSIDQGFGTFNKRTGVFEFIPGLKANSEHTFIDIIKILTVRSGQLFLADENGIFFYNPQASTFQFKYLPIAESQHGPLFAIRSVLDNPARGYRYFATDFGNGLNIQDVRTGKLKALPVAVKTFRDDKIRVRGLFRDSRQRIWLLSRDYLYSFDEDGQRLNRITNPLGNAYNEDSVFFRSFCQSHSGSVWILSQEGQVFPFREDKSQLGSPLPLPRSLEPITYIQADRNGHLWMIGNNQLACYFPATGKTRIFTEITDSLPKGMRMRTLACDRNGYIWIAVSKTGLLRFREKENGKPELKWFYADERHPLNRILALHADPEGHLWIATISAVMRMNTIQNTFQIIPQYLGMDHATLGMNFFNGDSGRFFITTPGHYCEVDFARLNQPGFPPRAYIDVFKVYNATRSLSADGAVQEIQPDEKFFSFEYSCVDFSYQRHHEFAYRLVGWDADWISSGTRRYASYTNIPGGEYVFEVRAMNPEGVWGPVARVPILVKIPYYKTAWFISLMVLGLTGLVYGGYRYRIQDIRKTERLKAEFNQQIADTRMEALRAQMNPHFIFNSLNSINRYIIRNDVKTSSLYLTRFARLIRLVLDHSKHRLISLSGELEALKIYLDLEAFRFEKKFEYEIQTAGDVNPEEILVPPLIIQPYVENAIWHGLLHKEGDGKLSIRIARHGDILRVEVEDNGIGREKAREFKSRNAPTRESVGLKLTEERLQLSAGENSTPLSPEIIDLYDENGQACGTRVIIPIPV